MARTGPITRDTNTLALGLAQIRLGASAANLGNINPVLTSTDSIGAMAETNFTVEREFFFHYSGFPELRDKVIPLRESAMLTVAAEEITPKVLAYANGIDAASGYTDNDSGEIALGAVTSPTSIRAEAHYVFPSGTKYMDIIFPKAEISSNIELNLSKEEVISTPMTISAVDASSDAGGNAVWDSKPLGRVVFTAD